ncbi:MAG: hypothetical protein ACO1SV_00765 [Fimbriimonas sp.]
MGTYGDKPGFFDRLIDRIGECGDRWELFYERVYLRVRKRPAPSQLQRERIRRRVDEMMARPFNLEDLKNAICVCGPRVAEDPDPDRPPK